MTTTETLTTSVDCPICGSPLHKVGTSLRCDDCEVDFLDNSGS